MSKTKSELIKYFSQLLLPENFEDYAPNGLQIEGGEKIQKVAFAVSATQDSIQKAIAWGAQALVVHHGVIWKYQGGRPITGAWGERIRLCVKNDLNLFAFHLPLDAHLEVGNAVSLARELGIKNITPFGPYKRQFLGAKGEFDSPLSGAELKTKLEGVLSHSIIHAEPGPDKKIKSIGIITGGANNEWSVALSEGLDAYLTGEISEYNWHDSKEAGVHYFAGGHHATERPGIKSLMEKAKKDLSIEVNFFDSENPA
jgi:dinuclear metal center YbgI/SA1388 family protein